MAGCTLAVVSPGRVGGLTGTPGYLLPQRPAEVPLLWDKKEAVHFPRKALDHNGQEAGSGLAPQPQKHLEPPQSEDQS